MPDQRDLLLRLDRARAQRAPTCARRAACARPCRRRDTPMRARAAAASPAAPRRGPRAVVDALLERERLAASSTWRSRVSSWFLIAAAPPSRREASRGSPSRRPTARAAGRRASYRRSARSPAGALRGSRGRAAASPRSRPAWGMCRSSSTRSGALCVHSGETCAESVVLTRFRNPRAQEPLQQQHVGRLVVDDQDARPLGVRPRRSRGPASSVHQQAHEPGPRRAAW